MDTLQRVGDDTLADLIAQTEHDLDAERAIGRADFHPLDPIRPPTVVEQRLDALLDALREVARHRERERESAAREGGF